MKKTTRYKNLEKIVLSHFPDAKWNDKNQRWEAETRPNKKDSWDKPESLAEFEKEADKSFYSYMSGTGWDDAGNITITVRKNIFESTMKHLPTLEQFINESKVNEGEWSKIMKGIKGGGNGPWTIVAIDNKKVIGQEIVKTKDAIPAHYESMKKEYPKAKLHIEDEGGQVVWVKESEVNEEESIIISESSKIDLNDKYALVLVGGSIGTTFNNVFVGGQMGTIFKTSNDKDDLVDSKKRMNKQLSPGEKGYYGMSYKVIELTSRVKKTIEDLASKAKENSKVVDIEESKVNEAKIMYQKGKSYQTGDGWVVFVDKSMSGLDIKVNNSAGWKLDPHDTKEEDLILMDAGRQRASITFKEGNINAFAKKMWDLNDRTTYGEKQGLTPEDYADIIRVWIDMRKETRK